MADGKPRVSRPAESGPLCMREKQRPLNVSLRQEIYFRVRSISRVGRPPLNFYEDFIFQLYTFFTHQIAFSTAVKRILRSSVRLLARPFIGIHAF